MQDVNKRTDWEEMEKEVYALMKRLQKKPKELKNGHHLEPGSILNSFRDGNLTFNQAKSELKRWGKKSSDHICHVSRAVLGKSRSKRNIHVSVEVKLV